MIFRDRHFCFFCNAKIRNPEKNIIRYVYEDGEISAPICDKCAEILDDEADNEKKTI